MEEVDRAVGAAKEAFESLAADVAVAAGRGDVPPARARRRQPQGARRHAHLRARQGALRRPGRDRPRPREHRVRLRHPPPAEGRVQRAGLDRRRRVLHPPAPRRRGRHHAVQLPGHGADVDVRQRHRLRQHVHPQAVREGSVGVAVHGRAAQGGRPARRRVQRGPGRQGGRRPHPRAPRHRRGVSFVGSTPIARYIYETGTRNGKRVQALGGAKNHMVVLPDADIDMAADAAVSAGYGSAGERCMAISVVVAVGDVGRPAGRRPSRPACPSCKVGPGTEPDSEMGPLITREHRDKVASLPRRGDRRAGRHRRGRRPHAPRSTGDGFFLGVSLVDDVEPDQWMLHATRSSDRCCRVVRVATYDEALRLVNDNPYGNGTAIFTRDGGAARQFQFDVQRRHGRRQRAHPGARGVLQLRRLEGVAVRRHPHVRPGRRPLLHTGQGRHVAAGPTPRPPRSTSGSRRTR